MGASISQMDPQQLGEFRRIPATSDTELEIPTPSESRHVTDKKGFVIFGIVMLVLIPFLIYTFVKSDPRRRTHGIDSCGNLCGIVNSKIDGLSCSGKNYTTQPYEKEIISSGERICTDQCPPGYQDDFGRCIRNGKIDNEEVNVTISQETWDDVKSSSWKFLFVLIATITLCVLLLLAFRYASVVVVWSILTLSLICLIVLTCLAWWLYITLDKSEPTRQGVLVGAIFLSIFTVAAIILVIFLFKKIGLLALLYKETARAIFAIPSVLLLPVISIVLQFLVIGLVTFTTVTMVTAGDLKKVAENQYEYVTNGAMMFTIVFNVIVAGWALRFLAACQYMVTAGSVASWFFSKNQLYLDYPVLTSIKNTFKFHLGTLAFGSFILTLVALIKALIQSLIKNDKVRWIVDCCCANIEAFLKFLSNNAYIQTAIHGQSFFRSGKRAAKLLISNASSVIAINSVGDFILAMAQFFLLATSTGIAYGLFANNSSVLVSTVISFIINLIIIVFMFAVFETTVDTLFICYCEDQTINDGVSRPYIMSKNLMQFVENSKKFEKKK